MDTIEGKLLKELKRPVFKVIHEGLYLGLTDFLFLPGGTYRGFKLLERHITKLKDLAKETKNEDVMHIADKSFQQDSASVNLTIIVGELTKISVYALAGSYLIEKLFQ